MCRVGGPQPGAGIRQMLCQEVVFWSSGAGGEDSGGLAAVRWSRYSPVGHRHWRQTDADSREETLQL